MEIKIHFCQGKSTSLHHSSAKKVVAVQIGDGFGSTIDLGIFSGDEVKDLAQYLRDTADELDPQEDD